MTAPMVPRRARLKPEDFQTFGYTVGCPGCDQLQIGGPVRRNHNDICRDRIEAELSKTGTGKDRLGRAKDRLDAEIVEMVEEMADGPRHPKEVSHEEQQTQGEMPSASTNMEDEVQLEEGPNGNTETRVSTSGTESITWGPQTDFESRKGEETQTTWMKTSTRPASSIGE